MKTVLLVDDDNTVLLTLGMRLKSMGYTVFTAKDAVNAVSAVRKSNPADFYNRERRLKVARPSDEIWRHGVSPKAVRREYAGRRHRIIAVFRRNLDATNSRNVTE